MPGERIFVSHSHNDNAFGLRLVRDLRRVLGEDEAVWYDAAGGLRGGDHWQEKIIAELRARPIFLVILSPQAVTSTWVQREVRLADEPLADGRKRRIIPLLYHDCAIPKRLKGIQYISFASSPTQDADAAYAAGLEQLQEVLGLLPMRIALPIQRTALLQQPEQRDHASEADAEVAASTPNRLIWGDVKYVIPSLLKEYRAQVDLIYLDPPFLADATFERRLGREEKSERYEKWLRTVLAALRPLLHPEGALCLHLPGGDGQMGALAHRATTWAFDDLTLINQFSYQRHTWSPDRDFQNHELLLLYSPTPTRTWNRLPRSDDGSTHRGFVPDPDGSGRWMRWETLTLPGLGAASRNQPWHGYGPAAQGRHWKSSPEELDALDREGRIHWPLPGGEPRLKRYFDELPPPPVPPHWDDIPPVLQTVEHRVSIAGVQPVALLERLITIASDPGDLVFDPFCGSGTTAVAASALARRWIAADNNHYAVCLTGQRLLDQQPARPFAVENVGTYEVAAWRVDAPVGLSAAERAADHRAFMLHCFHADPLTGYTWLHGQRAGWLVSVFPPGAPVTAEEIAVVAQEAQEQFSGPVSGFFVLAWTFAPGLTDESGTARTAGKLPVVCKRIPDEVLDQALQAQGDIRFLQDATLTLHVDLSAATGHRAKEVGWHATLSIVDYHCPELADQAASARAWKPNTARRAWQRSIVGLWVQWGDTAVGGHDTLLPPGTFAAGCAATYTYTSPGFYRAHVAVLDAFGRITRIQCSIQVSRD